MGVAAVEGTGASFASHPRVKGADILPFYHILFTLICCPFFCSHNPFDFCYLAHRSSGTEIT